MRIFAWIVVIITGSLFLASGGSLIAKSQIPGLSGIVALALVLCGFLGGIGVLRRYGWGRPLLAMFFVGLAMASFLRHGRLESVTAGAWILAGLFLAVVAALYKAELFGTTQKGES